MAMSSALTRPRRISRARIFTVTAISLLVISLAAAVFFLLSLRAEAAQLEHALSAEKQSLSETQTELTAVQAALAELEASLAETPAGPLVSPTDYQLLYPDLYTTPAAAWRGEADKTFYLTFDDGPSQYTDEILDVLAEQNVKGTFFIVGDCIPGREELLRRIVDEGHALAIHTNTHKYGEIYASVEAFLTDFDMVRNRIAEVTGVECDIFRFPGGSINSYNRATCTAIISEMTRRGFTYYDWNISAGDATASPTERSVTNTLLEQYPKYDRAIILTHEKSFSAAVLATVLPEMLEAGYHFETMDSAVEPVIFGYPRPHY